MKRFLYILLLVVSGQWSVVSGQARVFIKSGYIVMGTTAATKTHPTYLIIHNPAANAITQIGGGIISEKEWGMLWWDIGAPATAITYTVPFSYNNTTNIPLTVAIALANGGTASGAG